jgi:hypothetical protein
MSFEMSDLLFKINTKFKTNAFTTQLNKKGLTREKGEVSGTVVGNERSHELVLVDNDVYVMLCAPVVLHDEHFRPVPQTYRLIIGLLSEAFGGGAMSLPKLLGARDNSRADSAISVFQLQHEWVAHSARPQRKNKLTVL